MDDNQKIIIPSYQQEDIKTYTTITYATNNVCTVRLLKNLMSGRFGELGAINTYIFQHLILNNENINLKKDLDFIAMEEMKHLELLGNAIISFGGIPKYTNGQGQPWSARFVNYETDIKSFLNQNIKGEEMAIRNYEFVMNKVANQSLKTLLQEIVDDEKQHIVIFKKYLNNV